MYSVEDLLISHGYKPARGLPARREDGPEGRRHARARPRAALGLLNGCKDGPAASAGKGHVSDAAESRRSAPRDRGEPGASAPRPPEAGFAQRPASAWSSRPQIGHEQGCRSRGGQEAGNRLGPRDRQDPEGRGMAQAQGVPANVRTGAWEVGGRTEVVMKKAAWEDELSMAGPAKWPDASSEAWRSQPRKLGRQVSDGGGEALFQDLYPFAQGGRGLTAQNKKKSRSLPRVLSPESLSPVQIPIPFNDGHVPGLPKAPTYPPNCAPHVEYTKIPEKGGSLAPLPRPKFGKPVKPPSYGSHQPGRGPEKGDLPSGLTKAPDPRHERSPSDSGLEPPGYVPPPSYRSPPQHIPNPYLEDTAPTPVDGGPGHQPHLAEAPEAVCAPPSGAVGTENEYGGSPGSPWELPPHPRPLAAAHEGYEGYVQYIPFDDPRIRHIKVAQPPGFCEAAKLEDQPHGLGPATAREPALGRRQRGVALLHPQGPEPPAGSEGAPAPAPADPPWLWGPLLGERENGGFSDQRDVCVMKGQRAGARGDLQGPEECQLLSLNPQEEPTWETRTKVRKFEPGIQTKKTSKKKASETIFCLVSIPVKSEPHLPERDRNNNDLKRSADKKRGAGAGGGPALQEQALLSLSSTDLELQALTGSMLGRTELAKQDLGEPGEDREISDLRILHLAKQGALKFAGSWPGHQYRDQQTQTSFPEESGSPQLPPSANLGGPSSTVPTPNCADPGASEVHAHLVVASGDQNQKPSAPDLARHASPGPPSTSAFVSPPASAKEAPVQKAGQGQPWMDGRGPGAQPAPRPEVVKAEAASGSCNTQQPFGQFLLKPVSRRPWDLISQLESFNKELQEGESPPGSSSGSSSSGEEENEMEEQWPDLENCRARAWGRVPESSPGERAGQPPEDPAFQPGKVESQAESRSEGPRAGPLRVPPASPHCLQTEGSREGSPITEERSPGVVNGMNALELSPGPARRMTPSGPNDTKTVSPSCLAEPEEPPERPELTGAFSPAQPDQRAALQVAGGEGGDAEVPLSLTDKTLGLSALDLQSVGLEEPDQGEQGAGKLDGALDEEGRAVDIPPSESLQDRAARILGIDVAVESLLPGTQRAGQSQPPEEPDASACSPQPLRGKSAPSSAPPAGPRATTDAFYGRRKCGWIESPLFVGERAPPAPEYLEEDGGPTSPASSPEPQPDAVEAQSSGAKPAFRSTLLHFVKRTPSSVGPEKRFRNPSKAIESLQERLASPPRRADPERMMRMKEVSSVSRLRCLSARGQEATEEAEEPKGARGQAWQPGDLVAPSGGADRAWKGGPPLPGSTDAISWEESGHRAAQREKSVDQGFWCPDSYDPSRVERV